MESAVRMPSAPPGEPRYVAAFYQPASGWTLAAQSPCRGPVDYAVAAMIQTVQARGQAPAVEIWGPSEDRRKWRRLDAFRARSGTVGAQPAPVGRQSERSAREERLRDRRHQVLLAALGAAGLTDLGAADSAAMAQIVDALDEEAVRAIARWLAAANERI
jgi:hypothetical protein